MKGGITEEMRGSLELSLVMPAYNEANTIEAVVERVDHVVKQTGLKYELIVVDDGSVDDTRKRAINFANNNSHVKVVSYARNIGKGHAIKTGFVHAKGDAIIFMDSDLDIDPKQITRYIHALKHSDMVIASKWHPQSTVDIPLMRKILGYSFNLLVKLLTGLRFKDTQTGLKAIRRNALEKILPKLIVKGYAFDVELMVVAKLYGLKVFELPVDIRMRGIFSLQKVQRMFLDLLRITYRLRVLKQY